MLKGWVRNSAKCLTLMRAEPATCSRRSSFGSSSQATEQVTNQQRKAPSGAGSTDSSRRKPTATRGETIHILARPLVGSPVCRRGDLHTVLNVVWAVFGDSHPQSRCDTLGKRTPRSLKRSMSPSEPSNANTTNPEESAQEDEKEGPLRPDLLFGSISDCPRCLCLLISLWGLPTHCRTVRRSSGCRARRLYTQPKSAIPNPWSGKSL